jgi:hypothetical protein
MLLSVVLAVVAFVVFFRRAGRVGESRKVFWGLSGAAAVIGPSVVAAVVVQAASSSLDHGPESSGLMLINVVVVLCLIGSLLLCKWLLDRFLPIARQPLDAQEVEVIEDE